MEMSTRALGYAKVHFHTLKCTHVLNSESRDVFEYSYIGKNPFNTHSHNALKLGEGLDVLFLIGYLIVIALCAVK